MGNDIARANTGACGGAIRCHIGDLQGLPTTIRCSPRFDLHAQPATNHLAVIDEILHDKYGQVGRYGEADANAGGGISALIAACVNQRVDSQEVPLAVDQCATRVAQMNDGVGLDIVFIGAELQTEATQG